MDQLAAFLRAPLSAATIVMWSIGGLAVTLVVVELLRPTPRYRSWSRWRAVALPLAVLVSLLVTPAAAVLRADAFSIAMLLRIGAFWAMATTAPITVGQALGLRPPRWLHVAHLGLAATHLTLFLASDLVYLHPIAHRPAAHFGALSSPLLLPVAVLAGWWLLLVLDRVPTTGGRTLFALGGSTTALALVVTGLVVDPVLADHFLTVAFLPVLLATSIVQLAELLRSRRPTLPA